MSSTYDVWENKLQDPNATPISLPLEYLKAITHNFSTESELGRGGFGVVYKGVLQSGKIIAVKKLFEVRLKEETFQNEVRYLMGIKHQHIVQLVGYCAESTWEAIELPSGSGNHIFAEIPKRLLCFEYICNKGLDKYISEESLGLEWNMRYEIIKGICSGLHFLHEECRIVHLDLKPENILMDAAMIPKIADFGLSRIFGDQQSRIITDSRAGTCGYMAPEYQFQGLVSIKADIFSLGVIIVEMMTGRREYPFFQQGSPQSVDTSFRYFKENVLRSWRNKFISTSKFTSVEKCMQQVEQCITIALKCVDPETVKRPTAKDIIQILHEADQKILMRHNPDRLHSLDTHPTEPWILTGHDSGYARIWNHEMKQPINQLKVSKDAVSIVKFIARKEWIVAITSCGELHVYGCACATKIGKITSVGPSCPPPEGTPTPLLAVHPILQYVLSPDIVLLDWDLGWKRKQSFHNANEKIVAFNPEDDNSFVSGSFGGEVKVWRLGSSVPEYSLPGHLDTVTSLDFIRGGDQQYLITGSDDCTAKIWDLQKRECICTLKARSPVRSVFAHPNLPVLVTGTKHGTIHVWSSTDFRLNRTIKLGGGGAVVSLACLTGSRRIVIGQRNTVCTRNIHDDEAIALQEM